MVKLTAPRMVPRPAMCEAHDPQVTTDTRRVDRVVQRRVREPAEAGGAAGREETGRTAINPPKR